ncbi:hypothetical protein Val02_91850 [Virgisporangium aliadipatigenens]|uniref:Sulfatase n=1 Tax=Virgisporangium aliadipatigenens TaxID=741659 RepID=A0A8J4DVY5_9ACTN|nr:sulfatase [Virgisporangium aliadipatigenens]GIJ52299.1 hypothetical protein Val02_91850 [Virgisporangium aliadipatigenens]
MSRLAETVRREEVDPAAGREEAAPRSRVILRRTLTVLAGLLVIAALVAPNQLSRLSIVSFLRLPLEILFGLGVILVARPRARTWVALLSGVFVGLLLIVKLLDMGFYSSLSRSFDLVLDWILLPSALGVVSSSFGTGGAAAAVAVVVLLVVAVLALMILSVRRVANAAARHETLGFRVLVGLAVVWVVTAAIGILPADYTATAMVADRAKQVQLGLRDQEAFATEAAVDAFRDTPGSEMLTALRGKDVLFAFVESYGRSALENPYYVDEVTKVLDEGNTRLQAVGYHSRSGWLTSPTAGGGSWLAHATLLSGLWINNNQRHRSLLATSRLTINSAFKRAGCRTVGYMPAIDRAWPEGQFFGYDHVYDSRNMGYKGPKFSYAPQPDQYTLAQFQKNDREAAGRGPLMGEVALVSSHVPWTPLPKLIPWDQVGDGSIYHQAREGDPADEVWTSLDRVREMYRKSIEYSLGALISYVETYGGDNLVLVFLGDHQPSSVITGENVSRDVPITIVAKDPAVLERVNGWGWRDGLKPGPESAVWPMNEFRDRFFTAMGPKH